MVSTSTRTVVAATICLSLVGNASAFWRLQCEGILGVGRLDPIINPGDISGHVHTIKGGNGMFFSISWCSQGYPEYPSSNVCRCVLVQM